MLRTIEKHGGPDAILAGLANGKTLLGISKELKVSREMLSNWLHEDPERTERARVARETAAGALAEESLEIADTSEPGYSQKTRLQIETRRWLAEHYDPATFAQKPSVALNISIGGMHMDSLRRRPVQALPDPQVIDIEPLMD
jgi:hypothetical protein